MSQAPLSVFGVGDNGGNNSPLVHFGTGPNSGLTLPCTTTTPSAPTTLNETLRCLLLRHPGVIAFVNAHEHNNRINAWPRQDGAGKALGGFWQINTASHIDWPSQSRTIDIVDNHDSTLSLFTTVIDDDAAPNPGDAPASDSVERLASISRELAYNDPDSRNGEDGHDDARGARTDRNAELIVKNPYAG
jgi:hypothetical protein